MQNRQQQRQQPSRQRLTTWRNPTNRVVTISLFKSEGRPGTTHDTYDIEPGGEATIPSEFDRAIRETNKAGTVVGGQAPQLLRVGEKEADVHLHPSLLPGGASLTSKEQVLKDQLAEALADAEKLRAQVSAAEAQRHADSSALSAVMARLTALEAGANAPAAPAGKAKAGGAPPAAPASSAPAAG